MESQQGNWPSPRNMLYSKINESLNKEEVKSLRALLVGEKIPKGKVEEKTPHEIFNMLEDDHRIGKGNLGLLIGLLKLLSKTQLAVEAEDLERNERMTMPSTSKRKAPEEASSTKRAKMSRDDEDSASSAESDIGCSASASPQQDTEMPESQSGRNLMTSAEGAAGGSTFETVLGDVRKRINQLAKLINKGDVGPDVSVEFNLNTGQRATIKVTAANLKLADGCKFDEESAARQLFRSATHNKSHLQEDGMTVDETDEQDEKEERTELERGFNYIEAMAGQVGNDNISSASKDESQDSASLGATASLTQPPKAGKVRVYRIENSKFVQIGDNNRMVIQKVTPQKDDNQEVPVSKAAFKHSEDSKEATSQDGATAAVEEAVQLEEAAANVPKEEFDDQFLTCQICMNIYNDPRILPCLHTFCTRCLEEWQKESNKFICPACREQLPLGAEGVIGLPPNVYVNSLLDFRTLQTSKRASASCQMCESGASIEGTCGDCHLLLCRNCITAHGNAPTLKDHYIITLDDLKNPRSRSQYTRAKNCPKHNQRLMFYCQPCTKLVCQACTSTEHSRALKHHDPQEVSKAAQKIKAELQTLLGQTQDTADTLKKTAETVSMELTSITANCDMEGKKIQEHFAHLRAKLDGEEQKCRDKLREMECTQTEALLKERKGLKETLRSTEEGLQFCADILARGNDVEILTLRQQLEGRLKSLTASKISHRELEKAISFQPSLEMLTCNPGTVSMCNVGITVPELPVESLPTTLAPRGGCDRGWTCVCS
ncbi:PREDICTED: uncharacterized protein LOC109475944 isoform X2 [Branchiostoma belcheri]|nr:PREDICTED: uncharacterized protein LOC109475944 isoform X2 [Branchiostoma belcheri]XP_019632315.1 PREDICTED: uncharacterized protein LOC109475944 isoform X2 [Branchiostoma belcheri]